MGNIKCQKCADSTNGRCGPHYQNTICPKSWCSKFAWCGTTPLHKSTHQALYDGVSKGNTNCRRILYDNKELGLNSNVKSTVIKRNSAKV